MKRHVLAMFVLSMLSNSGCGPRDSEARSPGGEVTGTTQVSREDWMRQYVRWDDAVKAYVVEGDLLLETPEEVSDYFERWRQQGALTVHRHNGADSVWNGSQKRALTYCVTKQFGGDYDAVVSAMRLAAIGWEHVANVRFIHLPDQDGACTPANTQVLFNVSPTQFSTSTAASAFFPFNARPDRQVLIDWAKSTSAGYWPFVSILKHELGHVLGFRHEHIRASGTNCQETSPWRPVTPYDSSSIMHYWSCPGASSYADTVITQWDADGAAALYGAQTNVVLAGNAVYARKAATDELYKFNETSRAWSRVSGPGQSFAAVGSALYRISFGTRTVSRSTDNSTWTSIGGETGRLFAGQDFLYATDVDPGNIWRFVEGAGRWDFVGGPGRTFAAANSTLFGVVPDSRAMYRLRSVGGWDYVESASNGMNGISQLYPGRDVLYATDAAAGNVWRFIEASREWQLVGGPGRTFAVAGSTLYGLTPDGSEIFRLGADGVWSRIGEAAAWIYGGSGDRLCATSATTEQIRCYHNTTRQWTELGLP